MLKVQGTKIVDPNGKEVLLRGVNCAGLEWNSNDNDIINRIEVALTDWNANLIRLPISQDRWFGFAKEQQSAQNFLAYRQKVDDILALVKKHSAYLLFDLHWSNKDRWGEFIGQHNMPDTNSIVFWRDASLRYKNDDAVLFGIYNEPKNVSWDVWKNGGTVIEEGVTYHAVGIQTLIDVIRETGAKNIIVAGGLDWAYTFENMKEEVGLLIDKNGNGIILDAHVYPWKRLAWDDDISIMKNDYPILIGEYGHYGENVNPHEGAQCLASTEWMPRILDWISKNNYHACAWDFHHSAGPCLIQRGSYEPTPFFGAYVKPFLHKKN